MSKKLPDFLQSALWSYDLSKMDPANEKDKFLIITQILNHGTWKQLVWLLKTYTKDEIKKVILNPSRGVWHKDSLDYWLTILGGRVPKVKYQRSLFNLFPQPNVFRNT